MESKISDFIDKNKDEMTETLKALCVIPAPSHFEYKRALYCKMWLESAGSKGVYIDAAGNVVYPLGCENSNEITVFAAHTDTVFPDTEPMPYLDDGDKIHCPGAADNTASVTVLLELSKFFTEMKIIPPKGILFVWNSCEEGLGNLKGTKQLFEDYKGRIARFISFDSRLNTLNDRCVGSCRFRVEVTTRGGHSYSDFGNFNAVAVLSEIITEIYKIKVPEKEGTKTTYNVGTVLGGTSVNTVAQNAEMLCEYRSDDSKCMDIMKKKFETIFKNAEKDGVLVRVTEAGIRPCGNTSPEQIEELKELVIPVIEGVIGETVTCRSSSTDCNIPLSLGIPAICMGVCNYEGTHTREEWVEKESLTAGLEIAIKTALVLTNRRN